MKKINILLLVLSSFFASQGTILAQLTCNTLVQVSLDQDGEATLFPENILEGGPFSNVEISRDEVNFGPFVTFDCSDVGDSIAVTVRDTDDLSTCWGFVIISDMDKPVPYCVSLSTAIIGAGDNFVQLYAVDFSIASYDNCGIVSYTFGDSAFDFDAVVIDGITVSRDIDHYFDESGPIAAFENAPASVVNDFELGLIQLWHANYSSSSKAFLSDGPSVVTAVDMAVTDASGNFDFCTLNLTVVNNHITYLAGSCIGESIQATNFSCGPETLFAADYVDAAVQAENPKISYNNVAFFPTLPGDALTSGVNTIYVTYQVGDDYFSCSTDIVVEDNIAPVAVSEIDVTLHLSAGQGGVLTAVLTTEEADNGSYDLCSDVTLALSQTLFTEADIGVNLETLTVTDASGNTNATVLTVTVLEEEVILQGTCSVDSIITGPWSCGPETIYADDYVVGEDAVISFDGVHFSPSISGNQLTAGDNLIAARYTVGGELYGCNILIHIIDNIAPVVIANQGLIIALESGAGGTMTATLTASQVDGGSYDQCSPITKQISKTTFTEADLGENTVTLTVTDASGNWNSGWTIVTVIEAFDCSGDIEDLVTWPSPLLGVPDPNATPTAVSPAQLINNYGFPSQSVFPSFIEFCDAVLGVSYSDVVFTTSNGWSVERTFTAMNWSNSSIGTFVQTISPLQVGSGTLQCFNISVAVDEQPVTVFPLDVVLQNGGNPDNLELQITDEAGDIVIDNSITVDMIGQVMTYSVTDTDTGVSCSGTLTVVADDGLGVCSQGPGVSFTWPAAKLDIQDPEATVQDMSPVQLMANYGYSASEVRPVWDAACTNTLASNSSDLVFNITSSVPGNYFKIVRTWTVIDWTFNQVYSFNQEIKNTVNPLDYICDFLPRSAPLGDCESGHTDTDDVEWPSNIEVADHRISPSQLVSISGIDPLDAQPSFYGVPSDYLSGYFDIVSTFTSTTLTLERHWAIDRTDGSELSWTYVQQIIVDLEGFGNLVTTSTMTGRALPNVTVNDDLLTDQQGSIFLQNSEVNSLSRQDDFDAGVDLRDLVLMREHILGVITFDDNQLLAADLDDNSALTTFDILTVRRRLLGLVGEPTANWKFVRQTTAAGAPLPSGAYIGVKPGDVDDSFSFEAARIIEEDFAVEYQDQLLNKGETYEVTVDLSRATFIRGSRLVFDINADVLQVVGVEHDFPGVIEWNIDESGHLIIVTEAEEELYEVGTEETVMLTISLEAIENGILSETLAISEDDRSLFIDEGYDYNILKGNITGIISSTFDDPNNALSFVSVYPNPASDIVDFDFLNMDAVNVKIELLDMAGRVVAINQGTGTIDVSEIAPGAYLYKISAGQYVFTNKLMVIK